MQLWLRHARYFSVSAQHAAIMCLGPPCAWFEALAPAHRTGFSLGCRPDLACRSSAKPLSFRTPGAACKVSSAGAPSAHHHRTARPCLDASARALGELVPLAAAPRQRRLALRLLALQELQGNGTVEQLPPAVLHAARQRLRGLVLQAMICTHATEGDADVAFALLGHLEETEIPAPWRVVGVVRSSMGSYWFFLASQSLVSTWCHPPKRRIHEVDVFESLIGGLVSSGRLRSAFESFQRLRTVGK